jgi:hypothetical protein
MDKYGKDCGLACYNYEFQRFVTKFEYYFNELIQKLGMNTSISLILISSPYATLGLSSTGTLGS